MINADRYTKFVLTVIACTLLIFVFINFQVAFGQSISYRLQCTLSPERPSSLWAANNSLVTWRINCGGGGKVPE